jgi:hypothetical protein
MNLHDTHCCGVKEIDGLRSHNTPEEAMKKFCELNFKQRLAFRSQPASMGTVYAFYVFTAAVYKKFPKNDYRSSNRYYRRYGHEFAQFIKENKLGKIWTSAAIWNVAFHPDHKNKVWIWSPDVVALKAWWEAHKPAEKTKPQVAQQVQINNVVNYYPYAPEALNLNLGQGQGGFNGVGGNNNCGMVAGEGPKGPGEVVG